MPRIDPIQLLRCLSVLLSPNGGIRSTEEVKRLATLMLRFSKKLVSKCIYIQILKSTDTDVLGSFMGAGGWTLTLGWIDESIEAKNWPLVLEILQLLFLCPVDVERLKTNTFPKRVKGLSKEGNNPGVQFLASKLVERWLRVVKGEVVPPLIASELPPLPEFPEEIIINNHVSDQNCIEPVRDEKDETHLEELPSIDEEIKNEPIPPFKICFKNGKQVVSKIDDKIKNEDHKLSDAMSSDSDNHPISQGEKLLDSPKPIIKSDKKNSDKKSHSEKSLKDKESDGNKESDKSKEKESHKSRSTSSSRSSSKKSSSHSRSSSKSNGHHRRESGSRRESDSRRDSDSKKDGDSRKDNDPKKDSSKKYSKDKERHKSSDTKDNTSRDKSKELKNVDKNKDILDKIKDSKNISPLSKLGKIPKKSNTTDKTDVKKDKPSISIEVRKPNDPSRPKTVKMFHSKFRSHGLEEEAKPPPPRGSVKKVIPPVVTPPPVILKRSSPVHSTEAPPEKKAKVLENIEKPGAIKLIPAKPKHTDPIGQAALMIHEFCDLYLQDNQFAGTCEVLHVPSVLEILIRIHAPVPEEM